MKQMNPKLVEIVRGALSGKRLEKFNASVEIINQSLAQGAWMPRGSVKAESGFYQGLFGNSYEHEHQHGNKHSQDENSLDFCLCYGRTYQGKGNLSTVHNLYLSHAYWKTDESKRGKKLEKLSFKVVEAWVKLCAEKAVAFELLNDARPKPVLTAVLLSPKVTKTLKEMNLDIDLPSIKMPEIVVDRVETYIDDKGKEQKIKFYRIEWEKGIKHGMSRFSYGCQACGKPIPSGRFVPVEAKDKKSGSWVSFWLGCDCAKNIFGVKDIGIDKEKVVK